MEEKKKGEIKEIYSELRGYLAEAPTPKETYETIETESVWEQYNGTVDLLNNISGKDYNRFRIVPSRHSSSGDTYIEIVAYRQKLGGLISRLYGEYFEAETNPLDGVPGTVIAQSQQQGQSVHIQMILDIQSKIDEKIPNYPEESKEKGFLQKLKGSISSILNVNQLLQTIHKMAKEFGLNLDDVLKIFS